MSDDVLLEQLRPRAFAVAYRMLGSVSEAEDVVQESLLRVHKAVSSGERLQSPQAFVTTVATRLAITELQSARARREQYAGDWLPEPLLTSAAPAPSASAAPDPAEAAETSDSVSLALLVLLESLSPEQRAAFLLHDVFDYDYPDIASIIGKSEDNTRQLAARARKHVHDGRGRYQATPARHDELVRRFHAAAVDGDLAGLEALLAEDVTMCGDGGGKVPALGRTVQGRHRVAKTLVNGTRAFGGLPGVTFTVAEVNGGPGLVYRDAQDRILGVMGLDVVDGRIASVDAVVNPDKLRHLGEVGDTVALLAAGRGDGARG
jgi:RNA polymerase sigma-70 factor (ECF subfamily)